MRTPRSQEQTRQVATRVQHLRFKLAVLLVLCVLPGFGGLRMWLGGGSALPLWGYGIASLLAFFLYWSDKRKARDETWRTPEKVLHAIELFRHKTRKVSFQLVFWLIVLLHQVFWIDHLFLGASLAHLSFL